MSCITSIMIWGIGIDENKTLIDNWLAARDHKPLGYVDAFSNSIVMGGERGISGGLLLGGFNYLEVEDFETFLRCLDWDLREVWLYIKRPDDDSHTPINISHRYMFSHLCPICGKPRIEVNIKHPLAKGLAFFKVFDEPLGRYCTCDHTVDLVRDGRSPKRDKKKEEEK